MEEYRLGLRSSHKGFISQYFWSLLWVFVLFLAIDWSGHRIYSVYNEVNELYSLRDPIESFQDFERIGSSGKDNKYWYMSPVPLLHIGILVSYLIVGFILLGNVMTVLYSTRKIIKLSLNKEGNWRKAVTETYHFPFSKQTELVIFDRITEINVNQTGIDRLFNTGSLDMETVTFTNAGTDKQTLYIRAVSNPFDLKNDLESGVPAHQGVVVRLVKESA